MRTTVTIDDDVFNIVRYIAAEKKVAIGTVLSDLIRKGLQKSPEFSQRGLFPVFNVPNNASPITPEHVKMLEDEV
ncbi:MAG: CopG family transcriptional regulator [Thiothrix sp.]|nr:MAG: CopG family transcriptional regulator [Thiothrix sp.]